MLNRTRETAEYFDENTYAIKAMRMLDEIVIVAACLANSYRIPANVMVSPRRRFSNGTLKNSSFVESTNFTIDIAEMVAKVTSTWSSVSRASSLRSSGYKRMYFSLHIELLLGFCLRIT
jgi:hypothetical protein